jgi:hypothetical protein
LGERSFSAPKRERAPSYRDARSSQKGLGAYATTRGRKRSAPSTTRLRRQRPTPRRRPALPARTAARRRRGKRRGSKPRCGHKMCWNMPDYRGRRTLRTWSLPVTRWPACNVDVAICALGLHPEATPAVTLGNDPKGNFTGPEHNRRGPMPNLEERTTSRQDRRTSATRRTNPTPNHATIQQRRRSARSNMRWIRSVRARIRIRTRSSRARIRRTTTTTYRRRMQQGTTRRGGCTRLGPASPALGV